jgi:hypothetical protein
MSGQVARIAATLQMATDAHNNVTQGSVSEEAMVAAIHLAEYYIVCLNYIIQGSFKEEAQSQDNLDQTILSFLARNQNGELARDAYRAAHCSSHFFQQRIQAFIKQGTVIQEIRERKIYYKIAEGFQPDALA